MQDELNWKWTDKRQTWADGRRNTQAQLKKHEEAWLEGGWADAGPTEEEGEIDKGVEAGDPGERFFFFLDLEQLRVF